MTELSRVKIIDSNKTFLRPKYYINDKEINCVKTVNFRVSADEVPTFIFEAVGLPDIDMVGSIKFEFTPETVKDSIVVLRNELMKHGDFYNGFLASIVSAIRDSDNNICASEMAENILKRIIGEK